MKEQLDSYSTREKNLWFEFLVDIAVAIYYWPKAIALMLAGDGALRGGAMVGLITSTVILAIVISGALSIFLHTKQKPEPMDERDHMIQARASLWSGRVLVVGMLSIMGNIVLQEMIGEQAVGRGVFGLTPLLIAHLMLVMLMVASLVGTSVKLYLYRKGG
jgi:hypothetical protein